MRAPWANVSRKRCTILVRAYPKEQDRRRRQEAHALFDYTIEQPEPRYVLDRGRAAAEHGVELVHDVGQDLRVLFEKEERPRQRLRRPVLPSNEDPRHLRDKLVVGQGRAVLVAGMNQNGERVAAARRLAAPLVDQSPERLGDRMAYFEAAVEWGPRDGVGQGNGERGADDGTVAVELDPLSV